MQPASLLLPQQMHVERRNRTCRKKTDLKWTDLRLKEKEQSCVGSGGEHPRSRGDVQNLQSGEVEKERVSGIPGGKSKEGDQTSQQRGGREIS